MDPVLVVSNRLPDAERYDFGPSHPMRPVRLHLMFELMRACGVLEAPGVTVIDPRIADHDELLAVHTADYVHAVESLGTGAVNGAARLSLETRYGFHSSDNPAFHGMDRAAGGIAGGTVRAAQMIMTGRALHAFVPGGGLHHAHADRAAGFCVYNDPAVAIAWVRAATGGRVAYIDIDAHHGDGVQERFYSDPNVLTISLHESGHYLFPGTGFIHEFGEGDGYGYSINIPLEPHAGDAVLIRVLEEVVMPLVREYSPDLIVTQCGCDTHYLDPLTHLTGTTRFWPTAARMLHTLAHDCCEGRWLATGGGGYEPYSVVPRAWTMLLAEMADVPLPDMLPEAYLALRRQFSDQPMAESFLDDARVPVRSEYLAIAMQDAEQTIQLLREMPLPFRQRRAM